MRRDEFYVAILGIAVGLAGIGALGGAFGLKIGESIPFVTLTGTYVLWRSIVLLSAGGFYLGAARGGLAARPNQALVVMASAMLWIVAGTDLLGTLLGAIAGGPGVWIAPLGDVAAAFEPPYRPSLLAVPFTAIALRYLGDESADRRTTNGQDDEPNADGDRGQP
ncbi:hypothetical protein [Halapricum desulfuricans]|uniref:Putative membrane protein n=1 Tax=Halapricum desulfuricans TaxID=2841257 RepID=A0A897N065_9EURY|nr:hypothetical protein [Halapricum desulfuricans]QSG04733.1 putative membrane protein [Halapricum desulfuricans]